MGKVLTSLGHQGEWRLGSPCVEQNRIQGIRNRVHTSQRHALLSQLLAMDASARVTMKDAAKCDKRREWQNSENQENAERILHFQVIPGSMSTSGR